MMKKCLLVLILLLTSCDEGTQPSNKVDEKTVEKKEAVVETIEQVKELSQQKGVDVLSFDDFKHLPQKEVGEELYAVEYELKDGKVLVSAKTKDDAPFSILLINENGEEVSLKNDNVQNDEDQKGDH